MEIHANSPKLYYGFNTENIDTEFSLFRFVKYILKLCKLFIVLSSFTGVLFPSHVMHYSKRSKLDHQKQWVSENIAPILHKWRCIQYVTINLINDINIHAKNCYHLSLLKKEFSTVDMQVNNDCSYMSEDQHNSFSEQRQGRIW